MAASLNRATLIGHLGADPEIRTTQSGKLAATFSLATSESWRDKATGEKREVTDWHRVVVFSEGLAKIAEQYLKKGMPVLVEGQIKTRKYQGNDGQDRWTTEIVLSGFDAKIQMLGGNGGNRPPAADSTADYGRPSTGGASPNAGGQATGGYDPLDDDIPF